MAPKRQADLRPPLQRQKKAAPKQTAHLERPKKAAREKARGRSPDRSEKQPLQRANARQELLTPKERFQQPFSLMGVDLWVPPSGCQQKRKRGASSSSSTSTTSEAERRSLQKKRKRQSKSLLTGVMEQTNMTLLEHGAVGPQTRQLYAIELANFLKYASPRGIQSISSTDPATLDRILADYLTMLYVQGYQAYRGDRLGAAILHYHPEFGRLGSLKLPRMWRSIKGFRKLCPGKSRLAYPLPIWAAIATCMRQRNRLRMALFVLMAVSSYAFMELAAQPSGLVWTQAFDAQLLHCHWLEDLGELVVIEVPKWVFPIALFEILEKLVTPPYHPWRVQSNWHIVVAGLGSLWAFLCTPAHRTIGLGVTAPKQMFKSGVSGRRRSHSWGTRNQPAWQPPCRRCQQRSKTIAACASKTLGNHAWVPKGARLRRRQIQQGYVMDLFAGAGGVSKACEALGYFSKQWDIQNGPQHDLRKRDVLKKVLSEIRKGSAIMMAPVRTSFSRAQDRAKTIRTHRFPWGLPRRFLSEHEAASVQLGNSCLRSCIAIIKEANRFGIPWILEHPLSSRCWTLPPLRRLLEHSEAHFSHVDFCQFGPAWKKPTGLMYNNIVDSHRLTSVCQGHHGSCSRTGKKHFVLRGTGPQNNIPWCVHAEQYPKKLCHQLAHALTSAYHGCVDW